MELDQTNYCDDVDPKDANGNVVRPFQPDPHLDPCKTKIEVQAFAGLTTHTCLCPPADEPSRVAT